MPQSQQILANTQKWYRDMRRQSYRFALITLCKLLLVAVATLIFAGGWLLMQDSYKLHASNTLVLMGLYAAMFFILTKAYGGFRADQSSTELIFSQLLAVWLTDMFIFVMQALVLSAIPSMGYALLVFTAHIACAFLWPARITRLYARMKKPQRTLIIYHDDEAMPFVQTLRKKGTHYTVVKELRLDQVEGRLPEELSDIESVFICGVPSTQRNDIIKYCVARGIEAYVRPRTGDILMAGAKNVQMFHVPVLLCRRSGPPMYFSMFKRAMDILASLLMLIIFSPCMLGAAIAIKRHDGGAVFYKQERYTRNGKVFKMIKLRSMVPNAERDGVARLASERDSRITPVGAFIRKTRIDELPQLFNILWGDMSIVGPRPERPEIAAQYRQTLPEFDLRLQVKAGLTGYAQVHGKYNTDPYDKLQMDLLYIANQTIVEDLKLILYSLKIMFMKDSTNGVKAGQTTALAENSKETTEKLV